MKTLSIPAYYKDKKGREETTAYLETLTRQIMELAISGEDDALFNKAISELFSINFEPKFLDDTRFVAVSRYHVAITALEIWEHRGSLGMDRQLLYITSVSEVAKFIKNTYLPMCDKLLKSILHKHSNHGALAIMGKIIALKFLLRNDRTLVLKQKNYYADELSKMPKILEKHLEKAIITKRKSWLGTRGEFWIENLRTKSGLYYTYLHLAACTRAMVALSLFGRYTPSDRARELIYMSYMKYKSYFEGPQLWPHMNQTWIPILRQLQKLIFPSEKEFKEPRRLGKEGAFMNIIYKKVFDVDGYPYDVPHTFTELGPFPYSTFFIEDKNNFFVIL